MCKSIPTSIRKIYGGFTLAEILITLGIIGVVALLTVPTLINNVQKQQYASNFKKTAATLGNAGKQLAEYYGGTIPRDMHVPGNGSDHIVWYCEWRNLSGRRYFRMSCINGRLS